VIPIAFALQGHNAIHPVTSHGSQWCIELPFDEVLHVSDFLIIRHAIPFVVSGFTLHAAVVADELRQFVHEEFACQRKKFREQISMPREERVERGTCLDGLRFVGIENRHAVFQHQGNDSRLREGDLVLLRHNDSEAGEEGWIYREEKDTLWLGRDQGFRSRWENDPNQWFIDESFLDLEYAIPPGPGPAALDRHRAGTDSSIVDGRRGTGH